MKLTKAQKSAQGEDCTVTSHICNGDPETTVLAHIGFKGESTNKRRRPNERNAVYACSACHDAIDGRQWICDTWYASDRWRLIARALILTAERRDEKGV